MRKAFGYLVLIVCLLIYISSSYQKITDKLNAYKAKPNARIKSDRQYGDLYGMSYISSFRKNFKIEDSVKAIDCNDPKRIDLYEICDSYLWMFFNKGKYYCGVDKFKLATTNKRQILKLNLDTSKINVLLLEFSERNVRNILGNTPYMKNILTDSTAALKVQKTTGKKAKKSFLSIAKARLKQFYLRATVVLFNKNVNTNIENNIWDLPVFTPAKEFKADLNLKLFGKVNHDVQISRDRKQLFYNLTVDTNEIRSSFKFLPDREVDTLVARLNNIYDRGKQMGFNKIYLSIIPNPVSLLEPDINGLTYNHLVERVQTSPKLRVPLINVLPVFTAEKQKVYSKSDTHWNLTGAHTWLNAFNAQLDKDIKEDAAGAKK